VPKAAVTAETFETVKGLTQESSVVVTGKVRADKRAPGGYELDVEHVEVVQRVPEDDPFPISLKEHGTDFLMEHRHLWVRTPAPGGNFADSRGNYQGGTGLSGR